MKLKKIKIIGIITLIGGSLLSVGGKSLSAEEIKKSNINTETIDSDVKEINNTNIVSFSSKEMKKVITSKEAKEKASSEDFYKNISSKMQDYFKRFEKKQITEDELANLIKKNISPFLKTEDDQTALEISEEKSKENLITIQSNYVEYSLGKLGVNSKEINLFSKHPHNAAKTKNIADVASREAEKRYSKYTLWQGNGDAYRHALWNALMTKNIGRDWAYQVGYAHENLKPGAKAPDLDTEMDITNNYRGRLDGTTYKKYNDVQLTQIVANTVSDGKKVRIRTYTSGKADRILAGVKTKYVGKLVKTTSGGRKR
ncbi:hypothetical protein CHH79_13220 [Bacillus siamensis]|uniref:DUF6973 domain-containing protein n=1 Tax=Bacillus siamensis TaxID=659243 RepID=UPI000BA741A0|nr:hypothetical protein [Bacillus siamensis]PAD63092.1 hypothetical protein CHH79_13220 [Bacillus siamensis]